MLGTYEGWVFSPRINSLRRKRGSESGDGLDRSDMQRVGQTNYQMRDSWPRGYFNDGLEACEGAGDSEGWAQ
jgi:hypothetical protein